MERTFVVWDNAYCGFVESIGGAGGITHTLDLDGAFQFTDIDAARNASESIENSVVLDWR